MSELAELQAAFQGHVLGRDSEALARVVGDDRAPAAARLQVYHDAYRLRLIEVLARDFSGLRALAGDELFRDLAHDYLAAHPSAHPSVRWFGHALAGFLEQWPGGRERPELADMAAFEWAWGRAFDAADAEPVDAVAMAAIPPGHWGDVVVRLHPSLQRLQLGSNAPAYFLAVSRDEPPPAIERGTPRDWAVWRQALTVFWRSLSADEAFALDAFAAGAGFADVCEGLARWHAEDQIPLRAAGLLRQCLDDGLVCALSVHPKPG